MAPAVMTAKKDLAYFSKPENVFCYYYEHLDESRQKTYRKLAEGLFSFRPSITLRWITPNEIEEIYECLKKDLPAAFFDEGLEMTWWPGLFTVKVRPRYRFSQQKAESVLEEALNRTEGLIRQCRGKPDLEAETLVNDWLCSNVVYDTEYMWNLGGSSFELAGPLLWGRGVCSGISKAGKFLFDLLGIRSLILNGYVYTAAGQPGESHSWLMVKIRSPQGSRKAGTSGAQHYHLDITFNLTSKSKRYFNMTDREALADRVIT